MKYEFVTSMNYPTWLSNVVLVKKANRQWRVCMDFTNLNKTCLKDYFPLPIIDQLVDAMVAHQLLNFMDTCSGYNQINMYSSDQEHTSFITSKGLYNYTVMPFCLQNARVMYQRLVNQMVTQQIGKTIEVYVNNMLVKSLRIEDHLTYLVEMFDVLRVYGMKLIQISKHSKCL